MPLDNKFTINTHDADNLTIEPYDDDGVLLTDSRFHVGAFTSDTDTNKSGFIVDGEITMSSKLNAASDVKCGYLECSNMYGSAAIHQTPNMMFQTDCQESMCVML